MLWVSSEEASGGRDKGEIRLGNQSEDKVINNCHIVGSRMFLEASLVFMQKHREDNASTHQDDEVEAVVRAAAGR